MMLVLAAAVAGAAAPVEVMVVGTYHFGNPGLDLNNSKADDVLSDARQRELSDLAAALAKFKPTKIAVERQVDDANLVDPGYATFSAETLRTKRDETAQIAYRLAKQQGLTQVYAIDETGGPGEPDYFPFGKIGEWATANKRDAEIGAMMGAGAAEAKKIEDLQKVHSVGGVLRELNSPDSVAKNQSFYYGLLAFGGTAAQPGADLNAMWYLRNAKIFAKLMTVAKPGDRILVVYGAGHGYWLRHFAATTPGYRNVEVAPLLEGQR